MLSKLLKNYIFISFDFIFFLSTKNEALFVQIPKYDPYNKGLLNIVETKTFKSLSPRVL